MKITTNELIESIRVAVKKQIKELPDVSPDGFFTVNELAKAMDIHPRLARRYLTLLKEEGRLDLTFVRREGIDGRYSRVPAYNVRELP